MSKVNEKNCGLSELELQVVCQAAALALSDAEIFDQIADEMDLDDSFLDSLRQRLQGRQ